MSRRVRRSAHSYRQSSSSDSDTEGNYSSTTGTGGEDDESVESLVASNTKQLRSPQAGRSNSRGIDKSSQKVLLHHIEAAGGLQAVLQNITAFCNTQASKDTGSKILYGEHYSKERRRVENKIHRWKSLSRAAYLAVLADFQVTPNVVTSSVGVSASQASSRQDMSKSSRKDSESKKAPRSKSVSSSKTTESVSVPTSNINEKPAAKMSSRMETRGGILYEYLDLDIQRPECCPYPFKIYPLTDMQGVEEDVLHDGFALTMRAEYFDLCGGERSVMAKGKVSKTKKVKPFPFKACVTGDKEIRVTCPLLSWTDRGNDDFKIKEQFHEDKYAKFLEGLDVSRNAFIQRAGKDKYETMEKIYVLRLIETSTTLIKLDATVLECNKKAAKKSHLSDPGLLRALAMNLNVDISSESDTFFREIEVSDQTYTLWEVAQAPRLLWQVANVAKQGRRVGDIEEDVDSDESEDDIVYQMKKANIVDPPGAGARMRTQNEGNAGAGARIPKRQDPQGSAGNHPNPYQGNAREREDLQDEQEQEQENNPRRPRSTGSLSGTVVAQLAQVLGSLGAVQSMDSGETLEEEPDDAISSLQPDSAISMQLDSAISMQPDSAISMQQEQTLHQHQQHNAGSSLRRAANAVSVQPHSTCNSMQEGQTQHQPDTTISVTQPTEVKPLVQTTKKKRSNAEVDVVHREARRATYVSKRDPFYVFIQLPVAIQVYIKGRFQTQTEQTQLMHKYLNRLFDLLGDVQKQVVMACEEGERFVLIKDALIEKFKESGYEEDGAENELQALLSDVSHL